jgi:hypothetical protein
MNTQNNIQAQTSLGRTAKPSQTRQASSANHKTNSTKNITADRDRPSLGYGQMSLGSVSEPAKPKRAKQPARHSVSPSLRYAILRRDHSSCRLCGTTATEGASLEVDHIVPVSRGGTNDPHNLQTLCHACNAGKSNQL